MLEDKLFNEWLSVLELLSGFSLFPEFMKDDILPHLINEVIRLLSGVVDLKYIRTCRYAESWRDKNKLINDMVLRIASVLIKCDNFNV
jgi:hypothetical protein